jgi:hypothetical protein
MDETPEEQPILPAKILSIKKGEPYKPREPSNYDRFIIASVATWIESGRGYKCACGSDHY